jgi:hypothetical protein
MKARRKFKAVRSPEAFDIHYERVAIWHRCRRDLLGWLSFFALGGRFLGRRFATRSGRTWRGCVVRRISCHAYSRNELRNDILAQLLIAHSLAPGDSCDNAAGGLWPLVLKRAIMTPAGWLPA